jgi:hypothetical protein
MRVMEFFRRHSKRLAWAGLALQCGLMSFVSIGYSLSTPRPDPHAQLGVVSIELAKLDHKLTFTDLQSAGMFVNVRCRECDFSAIAVAADRKRWLSLDDFEDPRFMGNLFKDGHALSLHFYGENIPAGQLLLDTALQTLRARFPGQEAAIQLVSRGFEDSQQFAEPVPP